MREDRVREQKDGPLHADSSQLGQGKPRSMACCISMPVSGQTMSGWRRDATHTRHLALPTSKVPVQVSSDVQRTRSGLVYVPLTSPRTAQLYDFAVYVTISDRIQTNALETMNSSKRNQREDTL
jgi:hypothetical protein